MIRKLNELIEQVPYLPLSFVYVLMTPFIWIVDLNFHISMKFANSVSANNIRTEGTGRVFNSRWRCLSENIHSESVLWYNVVSRLLFKRIIKKINELEDLFVEVINFLTFLWKIEVCSIWVKKHLHFHV